MASAPCVLRFRTYHMLDWLGTVIVKNKVYGKLLNYQIGLASFNMANQLQIDRSSSSFLLPSVNWFHKKIKIRLKEKHLVVQPNIKNDPQ